MSMENVNRIYEDIYLAYLLAGNIKNQRHSVTAITIVLYVLDKCRLLITRYFLRNFLTFLITPSYPKLTCIFCPN